MSEDTGRDESRIYSHTRENVSRRRFLKWMGGAAATLATGGMGAYELAEHSDEGHTIYDYFPHLKSVESTLSHGKEFHEVLSPSEAPRLISNIAAYLIKSELVKNGIDGITSETKEATMEFFNDQAKFQNKIHLGIAVTDELKKLIGKSGVTIPDFLDASFESGAEFSNMTYDPGFINGIVGENVTLHKEAGMIEDYLIKQVPGADIDFMIEFTLQNPGYTYAFLIKPSFNAKGIAGEPRVEMQLNNGALDVVYTTDQILSKKSSG